MISSSPAIILSVVDLPQPDGPTSATNSRSAMSRSIAAHDLDGAIALDEPFERHCRQRVQPFTAPKVSPDTSRFWMTKVSASAGAIITTASAHMPRQSMVNSEV